MELQDYRRTLGSFVTGVTVVTAFDEDGAPWGVTANSFTSVSLEPPVVSICIGKKGRTYPTFSRCTRFGINILAADQRDVALHFAGKAENRFESMPWEALPGGAPLLPGTAAWLDCSIQSRLDAGDHEIMLGRVEQHNHTIHAPLAYCRGVYFAAEQQEAVRG